MVCTTINNITNTFRKSKGREVERWLDIKIMSFFELIPRREIARAKEIFLNVGFIWFYFLCNANWLMRIARPIYSPSRSV